MNGILTHVSQPYAFGYTLESVHDIRSYFPYDIESKECKKNERTPKIFTSLFAMARSNLLYWRKREVAL